MLKLTIAAVDGFDDIAQQFVEFSPAVVVELEHSLFSISKWESKWELPFLSTADKTNEQTLDYIRCMAVNDDLTDELLERITEKDVSLVSDYIGAKQTATFFYEPPGNRRPVKQEIITAEVMYHWLVALQIDWEVQYWHINRLITLVKVCNAKNKTADPKKRTPVDRQALAQRNRELNEKRRRETGSAG